MIRYCGISALALLLVAAGCATVETESTDAGGAELEGMAAAEIAPMAPMAPLGPQVPAELNSVAFITEDLEEVLMVQKTTYQRSRTNTFEVMCTLKNVSEESLTLLARTQFFDADRLHQEGPGAWQMIFLPPNGVNTYKAHSYGTGVEYYYIEVLAQ